jgi:hypothetical protein
MVEKPGKVITMSRALNEIVLLCFILSVTGCQPVASPTSVQQRPSIETNKEVGKSEMVLIASVPDPAYKFASAALVERGIDSFDGCSRGVTGIRVKRQDADQAVAVLRSDASHHSYWLTLTIGRNDNLGWK